MDDDTEKTPFERIVELFVARGVEFIVIGGQAETLYGSARVSFDTDLCYRRTAENLRRLADALKELHPKLRGAPPDRRSASTPSRSPWAAISPFARWPVILI